MLQERLAAWKQKIMKLKGGLKPLQMKKDMCNKKKSVNLLSYGWSHRGERRANNIDQHSIFLLDSILNDCCFKDKSSKMKKTNVIVIK